MIGETKTLSSIHGSLPQPPKQKELVPLWRVGCYCKGGFFWAWSFIGLTSPFFSWYASNYWWRFLYLVIPLPPCSTRLLGWLLALTLVLALCLFFSPFCGCFPFMKFWKVSSKASRLSMCKALRDRFTVLWWT